MADTQHPHVLVLHKSTLALRFFQMIFAIFVLAVSIYAVIQAPIPGIILNITVAVVTLIALAYIVVATYVKPLIYQYWAILSLEIFCLVFWLISFALLASEVALAAAETCGGGFYDDYGDNYYNICTTENLYAISLFGACAGVGAIEFVLFMISLSLVSIALARHRRAGGRCTP